MTVNSLFNLTFMYELLLLIFGDWGLGIGDWAQSPIPNPQSPKLSQYLINKSYTI